MPHTLAFDVYGTLIDTAGVVSALSARLGDAATTFARLWRDKQLEYSFRRALMRRYDGGFTQCTAEALAFACAAHGLQIDAAERAALLALYRRLPAFADAPDGLAALRAAGHRLYAFSNGLPDDLAALLRTAGLLQHFDDLVSVHEVRSFKPDPAVYAYFLDRSGARTDDTWLVSSNPFDVIGAAAAGWRTVWVSRSAAQPFDPWGIEPTLVVRRLTELPAALPAR